MQDFISMLPRKASVFALIWTISVVHAAVDFRNDTIACAFREYDSCYRDIATLGTNFTAKYDETMEAINATCRAVSKVQQCVLNVAPICNSINLIGTTNRINGFIHNLCTNKTSDQTKFLSSSVCYNRYHHLRYNCVNKYDAGKKTDAKSLCCSNLKTLRCMEDDMRGVCPRNFTEFQGHLAETYKSYHSFLCGPYYKYCGEATRLLSTFGVVVTTVLSLIMQKMQ